MNGNGVVDAGEPEITAPVSLPAGASLSLVVAGTVASGQGQNDVLRASVLAESQTDVDVSDSRQDSVTVASGAFLNLTKSSSQSCDNPAQEGQSLDYLSLIHI